MYTCNGDSQLYVYPISCGVSLRIAMSQLVYMFSTVKNG